MQDMIVPFRSEIETLLFTILVVVIGYSLLISSARSQPLPIDIPDSTYIKDEIIISFQDGMLNPYYLGCEDDA